MPVTAGHDHHVRDPHSEVGAGLLGRDRARYGAGGGGRVGSGDTGARVSPPRLAAAGSDPPVPAERSRGGRRRETLGDRTQLRVGGGEQASTDRARAPHPSLCRLLLSRVFPVFSSFSKGQDLPCYHPPPRASPVGIAF